MTKPKMAIFAAGVAAVMSQTVLIREGLSFFTGNELVAGVILCLWLAWTGLGSIIFSKFKLRPEPVKVFSLLLLVYGFFLICAVIFLRAVPRIFLLPFGEVVPIEKIFIISAVALGPACLVLGSLFPAASRIMDPRRVYLVEGLGSFAGGLFFSFLLAGVVPGMGIIAITLAILVFSSTLLSSNKFLPAAAIIPLLFLFKIQTIEKYFRQIQMRGQTIVGLNESRYGTITVTRTGDQMNFYTNGLFDLSFPDAYAAEEAVHYPLLLHDAPENVLLIGGGIGDCVAQVFKHHCVRKLVYCELDPLIIDLGEKFTRLDLARMHSLQVIIGDARLYVKNTRDTFDVIIINLPDPVNCQLNRFYTKEFFHEAKNALEPGGILSVRTAAPPDIIGPVFAQFINTIDQTMRTSFANVILLPAEKLTYIATERNIQRDIARLLKARIDQRRLDLVYVNEYFFDYNFSPEKIAYIRSTIDKAEKHINTDLKPVCYYYTTVLWSGMATSGIKKIFSWLFNINPLFFILLLLPVIAFMRRSSVINLAVFAAGASGISVEVLLIILFQIFYGYVYSWLGALIAFFMLGLALGTIVYLKVKAFKNQARRKIASVQFGLVLYCLLILLLSTIGQAFAHFVIPVLLLIGGFLGGLHFPLAVGISGSDSAGKLYGLDLLGAATGALLTTVIFVPLLGITFTLVLFILLNLLVGIGLRVHTS